MGLLSSADFFELIISVGFLQKLRKPLNSRAYVSDQFILTNFVYASRPVKTVDLVHNVLSIKQLVILEHFTHGCHECNDMYGVGLFGVQLNVVEQRGPNALLLWAHLD